MKVECDVYLELKLKHTCFILRKRGQEGLLLGPLSGPLGHFLPQSVTIRLPSDLELTRLGVTITAALAKHFI